MRLDQGGSNVIPFSTSGRYAIPAPIELRSQALEKARRGVSNLHFADHLADHCHSTEEDLLVTARRWINEAYRHRADGLAFPHSEKITLAFGCLRGLLSTIPDGPREEEASQ